MAEFGTYRGERSVKMDLGEIGWESVEWIYLSWDGDKWWELMNTY